MFVLGTVQNLNLAKYMAFLRNLLATITGLIIFTLLSFFFFVGIASTFSPKDDVEVEENSILFLDFSGQIKERAQEKLFQKIFAPEKSPHSLLNIITAIKEAKTDERISGIYIESMYFGAGMAQAQQIRDALIDFKKSGKFIYAYGEFISEVDYYIASVADEMILNPTGSLELNGMGANIGFYTGLFEKLDIKPEIFRVGKFKSAVEPFIRKDMSEENRLQYTELLNSIYGTYLTNLSKTSNISQEKLKNISDNMLAYMPKDAEKYGLLKVGYKDQIVAQMKEKMGVDVKEKVPLINIRKYYKAVKNELDYSSNKVAVIVAEGAIGMSGDDGINGVKLSEEIKKARESKSVKAIVIRVNSPGGSITASELIWRELMLAQKEKPVIASMSDLAASGGYYISTPADTIIAEPNTITGSIGIFGMWFNLTDFMKNKLGITYDQVSTGKYSNINSPMKPLSDGERKIIQKMVDSGYDTFIGKVAASRGMTKEQVNEVAQGRVWSGEQAYEKGLVDILGDFDTAVKIAAEKAGVNDDYRVVYYPKQKDPIQQLMQDFSNNARVSLFGQMLDPMVKQLDKLQQMRGIQARLPVELTIN